MKIVFVHFGPKLPKYLILNIRRVCDFFPGHQVVLLVDRFHVDNLGRNNFQIIEVALDDQYSEIEGVLKHPKEFRDNFWFTSLARLTAICDFVIQNNSEVLHVESDVLLSSDFPIKGFLALDRPIAYTIIGENSGVASVLWISSKESAETLKEYVRNTVVMDPNTTDMRILGKFQKVYPKNIRVLASFPFENAKLAMPLPLDILEDFKYSQKHFNGFFDAADIGQYLFGDDPRNHRGIKYLRHELGTSYLRPSSLKYRYSKQRSFVEIDTHQTSNIYSLHIHSKNVSVFATSSSARKLQSAIMDGGLPERHVLVFHVFVIAIYKAILRRIHRILRIN